MENMTMQITGTPILIHPQLSPKSKKKQDHINLSKHIKNNIKVWIEKKMAPLGVKHVVLVSTDKQIFTFLYTFRFCIVPQAILLTLQGRSTNHYIPFIT